MVATFSWGLGFYGHGIYLAELQRAKGWPTSLMSTATTLYYLVGLAARHLRVRHSAAAWSAHMLLAGACLFSARGRRHRLCLRTLAAVRGLLRHGGRLDAGERRRADQRRRPLVLRKARARDQPGADRRELRRHHPDAADGRGRFALGLPRRDARSRPSSTFVVLVPTILLCVGKPPALVGRRRRKADAIRSARPGRVRARCAACSSGP